MWCTMCGKSTKAGVTECAECEKWWRENPPILPTWYKITDVVVTLLSLMLLAVALWTLPTVMLKIAGG